MKITKEKFKTVFPVFIDKLNEQDISNPDIYNVDSFNLFFSKDELLVKLLLKRSYKTENNWIAYPEQNKELIFTRILNNAWKRNSINLITYLFENIDIPAFQAIFVSDFKELRKHLESILRFDFSEMRRNPNVYSKELESLASIYNLDLESNTVEDDYIERRVNTVSDQEILKNFEILYNNEEFIKFLNESKLLNVKEFINFISLNYTISDFILDHNFMQIKSSNTIWRFDKFSKNQRFYKFFRNEF